MKFGKFFLCFMLALSAGVMFAGCGETEDPASPTGPTSGLQADGT